MLIWDRVLCSSNLIQLRLVLNCGSSCIHFSSVARRVPPHWMLHNARIKFMVWSVVGKKSVNWAMSLALYQPFINSDFFGSKPPSDPQLPFHPDKLLSQASEASYSFGCTLIEWPGLSLLPVPYSSRSHSNSSSYASCLKAVFASLTAPPLPASVFSRIVVFFPQSLMLVLTVYACVVTSTK